MPSARDLQLILSSPDEGRVLFGLNIALAAAVSDVRVVIFFALDAATFVCARHEPPARILEALRDLQSQGAETYCCSACIHEHCRVADGSQELVEGVLPAGLAAVVHRASDTHETITI